MFGRLSQLGLVLCLATAFVVAQDKKIPPPTPKPAPKSSPVKETRVWSAPAIPKPPRSVEWRDGITSEKAIPADPGVSIKFCISDGDVKINGSERNELRVFVRNGRKFEFRSLEKNETGKANWVWLTRASDERPIPGPFTNCLSGDSIEIDIPLKGSVTVEGRSGAVEIDSVSRAAVKLVEGDISVRNISSGLDARTDQGELFAENIGGEVSLETTSGNIVAFDLWSSRPDDPLKVKTLKGTISLQKVAHRQIDANALSGSVNYIGNFLGGGIYKFRSASGRIGLLLPDDVNCKVSASYGFGSFDSSFPLKILTEDKTSGGRNLVATLGAGTGSTVMLSTTSGVIRLRKQGQADLP